MCHNVIPFLRFLANICTFQLLLIKHSYLSKTLSSLGEGEKGCALSFFVCHFGFLDFLFLVDFLGKILYFFWGEKVMGEEALPDHLRCKRTDGRQWRCARRVMENKKLCELHFLQGRLRQNKEKVPASLKLQRKKRNENVNRGSVSGNPEIRVEIAKKLTRPVNGIGSVRVSEALDKALKKMKLKKGNLRLELIRVFLQRLVERRKKRRLIQNMEEELVRELPNGLMAISPTPVQHHIDNAGFQIKLGVDSGSEPAPRRCFRSKNIEPLPIGSLQVFIISQFWLPLCISCYLIATGLFRLYRMGGI